MFKNFKVKGPADRTLVYLTCFIQKCLEEIKRTPNEEKARAVVDQICREPVDLADSKNFMSALGLIDRTKLTKVSAAEKYL